MASFHFLEASLRRASREQGKPKGGSSAASQCEGSDLGDPGSSGGMMTPWSHETRRDGRRRRSRLSLPAGRRGSEPCRRHTDRARRGTCTSRAVQQPPLAFPPAPAATLVPLAPTGPTGRRARTTGELARPSADQRGFATATLGWGPIGERKAVRKDSAHHSQRSKLGVEAGECSSAVHGA